MPSQRIRGVGNEDSGRKEGEHILYVWPIWLLLGMSRLIARLLGLWDVMWTTLSQEHPFMGWKGERINWSTSFHLPSFELLTPALASLAVSNDSVAKRSYRTGDKQIVIAYWLMCVHWSPMWLSQNEWERTWNIGAAERYTFGFSLRKWTWVERWKQEKMQASSFEIKHKTILIFKLCICDTFINNTNKVNVGGVCEVWTAMAYLALWLIHILGSK